MRKLILTASLAATTMFAGAQTLTSKNGTPILPEANDWSIGFDATPMLNYFGNMFNGSTNNSVSMTYPSNNGMTIVGKMVKDENTAYRAKVAINFGSRTITTGAASFNTHADSIGTPSERSLTSNNIVLGAGIQKWRGKGRLKGYYGAEAMIGLGGATDTSYTYLKDLDATIDQGAGPQVTKYNSGSVFGIGVNGFIGVEYFFAPKMSLSAEYTWGIAFSSQGSDEIEYSVAENPSGTPVVSDKSTELGKESSFNVGVGNTVTPNVNNSGSGSGSIVLSFYF
jgi:hypothetical protein